jgi:flagellar basal-body rod modification protein FlgD
MTTASILGQYEANRANTAGNTNRVATDKDTFLKLLVAQLTHQDPLNPVEDKEFIAQLAQFTQVEELQNIRAAMDDLSAAMGIQQITNAASLLGMLVLAKGDNIHLGTNINGVSEAHDIDPRDPMQQGWKPIYFKPQHDIAQGVMNIYATDENGNPTGQIIFSTVLEADAYKGGKDYVLNWHGRNFNGDVMPPGTYVFNFVATDSGGQRVLVDTFSTGLAVGVETSPDGNHKIRLHDERTVNYLEIRELQLFIPPSGGGGEPWVDAETASKAASTAAAAAQKAAGDAAAAAKTAAEAAAAGDKPAAEAAAAAAQKAAEDAAAAAKAAEDA